MFQYRQHRRIHRHRQYHYYSSFAFRNMKIESKKATRKRFFLYTHNLNTFFKLEYTKNILAEGNKIYVLIKRDE